MTIKFICSCGKHLKARDEMAARRAACPRCGAPVGIPSLTPNQPGGEAPMTPMERLRHARNNKPSTEAISTKQDNPAAAPRPLDTRVVRLLSSRAQRLPDLTGQYLEKHWYQCLLYPLRAWRLCLGLGLLMPAFSAAVAVFLPQLLMENATVPGLVPIFHLTWVLLVVFLIAGIPCSFLDCVLASAAAGEVYYIRWSGNPLLTILFSGAKWVACFLAGPVVFGGVGFLYWLDCGDPTRVDWLILTELGVFTIASWIFVVLAANDRGRLRDVNPLAVADLAHRLGWRALVVFAAAVFLLAHGWVMLEGVAGVHMGALAGWSMLAAGWVSGVFFSTFFCRLMGVWCFRSRPAVEVEMDCPAAEDVRNSRKEPTKRPE